MASVLHYMLLYGLPTAGMIRFSEFQRFAGEELVRFFVFVDGLVNDILRQVVVAVRIGLEPVSDKLLVVGRLTFARLVAFFWPETAASPSLRTVVDAPQRC